MKNINAESMKERNRSLVLSKVRNNSLSRADLARETGLTRAAISIIVDGLINEGTVFEGESLDVKFGRKGRAIKLRLDRDYAIGLALYRDRVSVGSVDLEGNIKRYFRFFIDEKTDREEVLCHVRPILNEIIEEERDKRLLGIGVVAPGPISSEKGRILSPPNFGNWHNFKIVEYFEREYDTKVYLENMSNALALSEKHFGKGKDLHSFAEIITDLGIGSGIIINGNLYRGVNGLGNEIGHMTVDIDGEVCGCGNRGCVEMYASNRAIVKYAVSLDEKLDSWEKIVDSAEEGNKKGILVLKREAEYLSTLIVNIMNIFDLDTIVFAGEMCYKFDTLKNLISENVNTRALARNISKLNLYSSELGPNSDVLTPAVTVLKEFFK